MNGKIRRRSVLVWEDPTYYQTAAIFHFTRVIPPTFSAENSGVKMTSLRYSDSARAATSLRSCSSHWSTDQVPVRVTPLVMVRVCGLVVRFCFLICTLHFSGELCRRSKFLSDWLNHSRVRSCTLSSAKRLVVVTAALLIELTPVHPSYFIQL